MNIIILPLTDTSVDFGRPLLVKTCDIILSSALVKVHVEQRESSFDECVYSTPFVAFASFTLCVEAEP